MSSKTKQDKKSCNSLYSCAFKTCSCEFENSFLAQDHFQADHPTCSFCEAKFFWYEERTKHIEKWHPSCESCKLRFRTQDMYTDHWNSRLACRVCAVPTWWCSQFDLNTHQQTHPQCTECFHLLATESLRTAHVNANHRTCGVCKIYFDTRQEITDHLSTHKCTLCWVGGLCTPESLESHRESTHVKCFKCQLWLENHEAVEEHISRDELRCPTCQAHFQDTVARGKHYEDGFYCKLCPAEIQWYCRALETMFRSHNETKHVKCSRCVKETYLKDEAAYRIHKSEYHSYPRGRNR